MTSHFERTGSLTEHVDPLTCQASTADPGRAPVLKAIQARILLRLGRRTEGLSKMQQTLREMRAAGVSAAKIAPYRQSVSESVSAVLCTA